MKFKYKAKVMNRFDRHIEDFEGTIEAEDHATAMKRVKELHPLWTGIIVWDPESEEEPQW